MTTEQNQEPSLDDVVDILVGRMHTNPEEFAEYCEFGSLVTALDEWAEFKAGVANASRPVEFDFLNDSHMERLREGLRGVRCRAFIKKTVSAALGQSKKPVVDTVIGRKLISSGGGGAGGVWYAGGSGALGAPYGNQDPHGALAQKLVLDRYAQLQNASSSGNPDPLGILQEGDKP